jgi:hypothetical protein
MPLRRPPHLTVHPFYDVTTLEVGHDAAGKVQPWFHGALPRIDAEKLLLPKPAGTYSFLSSSQHPLATNGLAAQPCIPSILTPSLTLTVTLILPLTVILTATLTLQVHSWCGSRPHGLGM